jgi:hypothetical protein
VKFVADKSIGIANIQESRVASKEAIDEEVSPILKLSVPLPISLYKNGEILPGQYFLQVSPIFENSKLENYIVFKRKETKVIDIVKIKVSQVQSIKKQQANIYNL